MPQALRRENKPILKHVQENGWVECCISSNEKGDPQAALFSSDMCGLISPSQLLLVCHLSCPFWGPPR